MPHSESGVSITERLIFGSPKTVLNELIKLRRNGGSLDVVIEAAGTITKGMTLRGPGFILPVTYHLEDGTTVNSHVSSERKKNVLPRLERDRANAASGAMKAIFQDGRFFGTVTSYDIGARGLVATAT